MVIVFGYPTAKGHPMHTTTTPDLAAELTAATADAARHYAAAIREAPADPVYSRRLRATAHRHLTTAVRLADITDFVCDGRAAAPGTTAACARAEATLWNHAGDHTMHPGDWADLITALRGALGLPPNPRPAHGPRPPF